MRASSTQTKTPSLPAHPHTHTQPIIMSEAEAKTETAAAEAPAKEGEDVKATKRPAEVRTQTLIESWFSLEYFIECGSNEYRVARHILLSGPKRCFAVAVA